MIDLGAGSFESASEDGAVLLDLEGEGPTGWVEIDFAFSEEGTALAAPVLVVELGDSRPAERVELGPPMEGRVRAVVRLPAGYRMLYVRLVRKAVRFRMGPIVLRELGTPEAALRALLPVARRLVADPRRLPKAVAKATLLVRQGGFRLLRERLATRGHSPDRLDYGAWIAQYDKLRDADRAAIRTRIDGLPRKPLLSILMPLHETPEPLLRRAIGSVRAQLYPDWELCIAGDALAAPQVRRLLEEAGSEDDRIRFAPPCNGQIAAASNSALALARGEYVALLDHEDELSEHALAFMAEEIAAHPEADLLYSDEDKIDLEGHRHDPYFKPDFNPELLWSQNFFSHLGLYRRKLVVEAGCFREEFEGTQDYDLVLRCLARTASGRIRHLPRVLYHRRSAAGLAGAEVTSKPDAFAAAQRALQQHLASLDPGARVEPGRFAGTWRVRWPLPDPAPLVSIIVPTRDAAPVLARCIESLLGRTTYPNYELLIVDNGSRAPEAVALLARLAAGGRARVLRYDRPFNFSAINNFGVGQARGDVLVLLNDDTEVVSGEWLSELVSHAVRPGIGAVGARLLYPDGRVQHAGVVTGILGVAGHAFKGLPREARGYFSLPHLLREVSAVTGACLAVRKGAYEQVGGLDERELPVAFNDIDFCLKLRRAGYRNLYTPWAELLHHESYSRGSDHEGRRLRRFRREIDVMRRRWPDLAHDPGYNPNLSLETDGYDLAVPPRSAALGDRPI
jgi:O-antigen biosynthesis protein